MLNLKRINSFIQMGLMAVLVFDVGILHAADRVGNGGDAYLIADSSGKMIPYSLDLVEAGLELGADFHCSNPPGSMMTTIDHKTPLLTREAQEKLACKFQQISDFSEPIGRGIFGIFQMMDWAFVNLELSDVNDMTTNLAVDPKNLRQVAVRDGVQIQINRSLFQQMSADNQVAVIFHELFYSLVRAELVISKYAIRMLPTGSKGSPGCPDFELDIFHKEFTFYGVVNSDIPRSIVGHIFGKGFRLAGVSRFSELAVGVRGPTSSVGFRFEDLVKMGRLGENYPHLKSYSCDLFDLPAPIYVKKGARFFSIL